MRKKLAFFAGLALAASALWANVRLENGKLAVEFDDLGNLALLKNKISGENYAGGQGLWRIIYTQNELLEEPVESESVPVRVEKKSDTLATLSFGGEFPVEVACRLEAEEVRFSAKISNNSKDKILREFQFPMIKNAGIDKSASLVNSGGGGALVPDFYKHVERAETQYKSQDNIAVEHYVPYPMSRTMNMFVIQNPKGSLYFASIDPNFELTLHLARYRKENGKFKFLDVAMVKYPFIKPGESYATAEFAVAPTVGDWREGARLYARACESFFKIPERPEFIENMNGWQRIIMRHQYGRVFFPYAKLDSEIGTAGFECGLDTILLFGWWKEGMDAGYPDYSPETEQGGDAVLRENIRKYQARGGKVLLYFNGQLIDVSTDYYKSGRGEKVCVKTPSGLPHIERYPFGGDGTGLRVLGHKTFVTACHGTDEWERVLKGYVDRAVSLGVDGIFFDQLGSGSQICWDASHKHKVPCTDMMRHKSEMLGKIRAYIKSKKPDLAFGTEYVGDATSRHIDFAHSCGMDYSAAKKRPDGKPLMRYVPLFKYAFPKVIFSDRTIRDDSDIERRVNLCLMWGWTSDVEIYRCRATIDETPRYKAYLSAANALRGKYRSLILNGTYRDRDLAEVSDDRLDYTTFENDSQIAVFVANLWLDKPVSAKVSVDGATFAKSETLGKAEASGGGGNAEVSLGKNGMALLIFDKNKK